MASLKKMCDVFVVVFCWNQVRVRLILDPPTLLLLALTFLSFFGCSWKKKKKSDSVVP